jgi:hypothetical protein
MDKVKEKIGLCPCKCHKDWRNEPGIGCSVEKCRKFWAKNETKTKDRELKIWRDLNDTAEKRINQLKEAYQDKWYEASLKDDCYRYICWHIAMFKQRNNKGKEIIKEKKLRF